MDTAGTVKLASQRLYNLDLSKVGESAAKATRAVGNGAQAVFWAIVNEFINAWGTVMCWALLPGEKLGLWKLRKVSEPDGAPHATQRLFTLIQAWAWISESLLMIWGAVKLYRLYFGV